MIVVSIRHQSNQNILSHQHPSSDVAVTGLPVARRDHAVAMARFAQECLDSFGVLTKRLESTLGPDTGDLNLRVGIHSGPVTAGVLRGEKSRFQLFGDTVNTCSRIETTGEPGRIHLSEATAKLIMEGGKSKWLVKRTDLVSAKGKGTLETYWLRNPVRGLQSKLSSISNESPKSANFHDSLLTGAPVEEFTTQAEVDKVERLIDWLTDVMATILKQIIAKRESGSIAKVSTFTDPVVLQKQEQDTLRKNRPENSMVLNEVEEVIRIPKYTSSATPRPNPDDHLDEQVLSELREFVSRISKLYNDCNPCTYNHVICFLSHALFQSTTSPTPHT